MAIVEIACQCGHHGFVAASALPGVLRCHACDHAEFFRTGRRIVRSQHTVVIDNEMWATYEGGPPSKQATEPIFTCLRCQANYEVGHLSRPVSECPVCGWRREVRHKTRPSTSGRPEAEALSRSGTTESRNNLDVSACANRAAR
jgi:DNA-directed RNA polymerase subunit RPC12/RpoP